MRNYPKYGQHGLSNAEISAARSKLLSCRPESGEGESISPLTLSEKLKSAWDPAVLGSGQREHCEYAGFLLSLEQESMLLNLGLAKGASGFIPTKRGGNRS